MQSSVGFIVHQSESLDYWSIIQSVCWAVENKVSAQLDLQKKESHSKVKSNSVL